MPHDDDRGAQRRPIAMPLAARSSDDIYQSTQGLAGSDLPIDCQPV